MVEMELEMELEMEMEMEVNHFAFRNGFAAFTCQT